MTKLPKIVKNDRDEFYNFDIVFGRKRGLVFVFKIAPRRKVGKWFNEQVRLIPNRPKRIIPLDIAFDPPLCFFPGQSP